MARGALRGSARVVVEEGIAGSCTVGVLFRETVLEEPFPAAEETLGRGLIRGPGEAVIEGGSTRSCTQVVLNRCGGLEEPSPAVAKGSIGA